MSTTKSILAGAGLAALAVTGPIVWQVNEIQQATAALASSRVGEPTLPNKMTPAVEVKPTENVAKNGALPSAPGEAELMAFLEGFVAKEMDDAMASYFKRRAWMDARKLSLALQLSPKMEIELHQFMEKLMGKPLQEAASKDSVKVQTAAIDAWLQEHVTAEQYGAYKSHEQARKATLAEKLAEDALHGVSATVALTEEQKNKLYDAAAAKAIKSIQDNDYQRMLNFGAGVAPQAPLPLEERSPDLLASVLRPEQLELWEQAVEHDVTLKDKMPKRLVDHILTEIRERNLLPAINKLINEQMSEAPGTP